MIYLSFYFAIGLRCFKYDGINLLHVGSRKAIIQKWLDSTRVFTGVYLLCLFMLTKIDLVIEPSLSPAAINRIQHTWLLLFMWLPWIFKGTKAQGFLTNIVTLFLFCVLLPLWREGTDRSSSHGGLLMVAVTVFPPPAKSFSFQCCSIYFNKQILPALFLKLPFLKWRLIYLVRTIVNYPINQSAAVPIRIKESDRVFSIFSLFSANSVSFELTSSASRVTQERVTSLTTSEKLAFYFGAPRFLFGFFPFYCFCPNSYNAEKQHIL